MTTDTATDWHELCRTRQIDPDEVRLVFERYDAYRQFTERATGQAIGIEQWFRFYYEEKKSESTESSAPIPSGCSADGDAVNNACLKKPDEFLGVLVAYDRAQAVPHAGSEQ